MKQENVIVAVNVETSQTFVNKNTSKKFTQSYK